jgi:hypothetical protein
MATGGTVKARECPESDGGKIKTARTCFAVAPECRNAEQVRAVFVILTILRNRNTVRA